MKREAKADFSQGSVSLCILRLALPILLAETVHVLYNMVDRMFIARIPEIGTAALSGVGITFPLISAINAFASLCSTGGAPLSSARRGKGDEEGARRMVETALAMLVLLGLLLTFVLFFLADSVLPLLGATEETFPYAKDYFGIYVWGTTAVMMTLGGNSFINMQGSSLTAMMTVLIGAVLNIILDPILIFSLNLGVKGAALATVISQAAGAVWAGMYLFGKKARIRVKRLRIFLPDLRDMLKLGVSGFIFKITNSLTQGVANVTLSSFGGESGSLYVGAMSIANSVREMSSLPINALASGFQPVASYNAGAGKHSRVASSIRSFLVMALGTASLFWAAAMFFPDVLVRIFTPDEALVAVASPSLRIFFSFFFMMAFQSVGQNAFVSLNCPKRAVFFSFLRKAILVVPLTLILPSFGMGEKGVFLAEALSQLIGGTCCFLTMLITVYRKVSKAPDGSSVRY